MYCNYYFIKVQLHRTITRNTRILYLTTWRLESKHLKKIIRQRDNANHNIFISFIRQRNVEKKTT